MNSLNSVTSFGSLQEIYEKINNSERLNFQDGMNLLKSQDIFSLGALSGIVRKKNNGNKVFYSINLHLNHTNICNSRCKFCAFSKKKGTKGAYTLSLDEIYEKTKKAIEKFKINEIHIVGGNNPDLDLNYYVGMIRKIRDLDQNIYIKALTAVEIDDLAKRMNVSIEKVLISLKEAGLDHLPGGGAEIFDLRVRNKICPNKIASKRWLFIHEIAHNLNIKTNATMLYGHIEKHEDIIDHMFRLRALQDKTNGFCSFIPLPYNPENNLMTGIKATGGILDLKVFATARLIMDNIPHIKVHWAGLGLKLAQVLLSFGVDDIGGTNLNEKVMHDAGSSVATDLGKEELERIIKEAGYEPVLTTSAYKKL